MTDRKQIEIRRLEEAERRAYERFPESREEVEFWAAQTVWLDATWSDDPPAEHPEG